MMKALGTGLLLLLSGAFLSAQELPAPQQGPAASPTVNVEGQVQADASAIPPEGLDVVLLKFVVDAQGNVNTTGPVARIKSDAQGNFRFEQVPREMRAAYRLGSRVNGELISSELFFMSPDRVTFQVNIEPPTTSTDTEKLDIEQTSLVFEGGIGLLQMTEVLSISNATKDRIDTSEKPLTVELPDGFENFRMLEAQEGTDYRLSGNELSITRLFPPGGMQVLYQYQLPAFFGQATVVRPVKHSLELLSAFTSLDELTIQSDQLEYTGEQSMGGTQFRVWKGKAGTSTAAELTVRGIAVQPQVYVVVTLVVLAALVLVVLVFWKTRLSNRPEGA